MAYKSVMAARKNPRNLSQSYDMQRAKMLLNRLFKFSMGEVTMSGAQVRAAAVVINKEIPDVQKVTLSGGPDPILFSAVERIIVKK